MFRARQAEGGKVEIGVFNDEPQSKEASATEGMRVIEITFHPGLKPLLTLLALCGG
jgi:hypothetical protein